MDDRHFSNYRFITIGALLGSVLGLLGGLLIRAYPLPQADNWFAFFDGFGKLWTLLLVLVVIPLTVSYIMTAALAVKNRKVMGRIALYGIGLHLLILMIGITLSFSTTQWVLPLVMEPIPLDAIQSETGNKETTSALLDGYFFSILSQITKKGVLPILVSSFVFAILVTFLGSHVKAVLLRFFEKGLQYSKYFFDLLMWLLPLAIFGLTFVLIAKVGLSFAGMIGQFIVLLCLLLTFFTLIIYFLTFFLGQQKLVQFTKAMAPVNLLAIATRSSMACLPKILVQAEQKLQIPASFAGIALPFYMSTFRVNKAVSSVFNFFFLAFIFNIEIEFYNALFFILMVFPLSLSSPGIPSSAKFTTLPFYLAAGIPVEAVFLLKAFDAIPDYFKTIVNVTEVMAIGAIVNQKTKPSHDLFLSTDRPI